MTKQQKCVLTAWIDCIRISHKLNKWDALCYISAPALALQRISGVFLGVVVVGTPPSTNICLFIISAVWFHWNVQQKNWFCFFKKNLASVFPVGVYYTSLVNVIAVINLGYKIRTKRMNRQTIRTMKSNEKNTTTTIKRSELNKKQEIEEK